MCIQNNPNEARNMLLQNPQLAYALLQAQIVMKIVDPQVALVSYHHVLAASQAWKVLEKKQCPWKYLNQSEKVVESNLECVLLV